MDYFKGSLSKVLTSFIPKELIKINSKNFKKVGSIKEIPADEVFIITNDEVENIKEKALVDMIEDVRDKIALGICEDKVIAQIDDIDSDRVLRKEAENEDRFYQWKDLLGIRGNSQKRDRLYRLGEWISENNVNPILVDEIDNEFFITEKYGKEFIVSTSNMCIRRRDPYPVFIGTTNTKSYALPREARRRSYYLIIERILKKSPESAEFYKNIYEKIDNTLFLDFCYKMLSRLESASDYKWDNYTEDNNFDFLCNTREIFRNIRLCRKIFYDCQIFI